jgi:hypothetical protein
MPQPKRVDPPPPLIVDEHGQKALEDAAHALARLLGKQAALEWIAQQQAGGQS